MARDAQSEFLAATDSHRPVLHLCLAGPDITRHHALVEHLGRRHVVTLVRELQWLDDPSLVASSDALALEAEVQWRAVLRTLRRQLPALPVVLVDGALTDEEKAEAFALGALDFFPAPCHTDLLAERLVVLARAGRSGASSETPQPIGNLPAA